MRGDGTANNIIWLPLIKEFIEFIKTTYMYEYNDILDVERVIENLAAVPKDGLKYFVKYDNSNNLLNEIYQFDSEGIEIFSYTPVYKDRIIFVDIDRNIPNYIFDKNSIQREEGKKYNNSMAGSEGLTIFIGHNKENLFQSPSVNFLYKSENNISMYNRRNQPNSDKTFILSMLVMTSNENLYEDECSYDRFYSLQTILANFWGEYLSFCNGGEYKNRIVGTLPFEGKIINEVDYQPAILHEMSIRIEYK